MVPGLAKGELPDQHSKHQQADDGDAKREHLAEEISLQRVRHRQTHDAEDQSRKDDLREMRAKLRDIRNGL